MNSEQFISAFNQIEQHLRKKLGADTHVTFSDLVRRVSEKNPAIKIFKDDLLQFGDLRNAIVHSRKGDYVIAEPHPSTVDSINKILVKITEPKIVSSLFNSSVFVARTDDSLSSVLSIMLSKDFSQAPIMDHDKIIAMLNSEAIAKWLGSKADDLIAPQDTRVEEILSCSDTRNNFKLISRKTTLFEVLDIFIACIGNPTPLEALIITEHGKATEKPIGIITRSEDLAMVIREIQS